MTNEPTSAPSEFFESLRREHIEIEQRLKALEQAAHIVGRVENDAAALAIIADTLRFFAIEAALHQEHEELSLFPRLRSLPEFKQILSALEFQHRMNDATGAELVSCLDRFAAGRGRELRLLALRFVEMHRGHAFAEERALFPLAETTLPPKVLAEMNREMRERVSAANKAEGQR